MFIGRDYKTHQSYSEKIAAIIDEEIQKIVERNYERAFESHKRKFRYSENIVKLLFERKLSIQTKWIC